MISYCVNADGVLEIYLNDSILAEVSECFGYSSKQLERIVEDTLNDLGYQWNEDGSVDYIED